MSGETQIQHTGPTIDTADTNVEASTGAVTHAPRHVQHVGILPTLQSLVRIITIALFILTFIVQPFRIPSASMERTLLVGDFLLVNKQIYGQSSFWPHLLPYRNIQRGEIIVFYYPVDPSLHLVKRVVGLPGDRLHLVNGHVFVNGVALHEPYAIYRPSRADNYRDNFPKMDEADPAIETRWWIQMRSLVKNGELTVPPGDYFVMGDNRNNSEDSRYWGFVPRAAVEGEPLLVYLSLREPGLQEPSPDLPSSPSSESFLNKTRWERTLHIIR